MFSNPIIAMLRNVDTGRYHPIVFDESPLPGPESEGKPIRHKSRMHHTGGFPTREEAVTNARTDLAARIPGVRFELGIDLEWDGKGIPALVAFFPKSELAFHVCTNKIGPIHYLKQIDGHYYWSADEPTAFSREDADRLCAEHSSDEAFVKPIE